MDEELMKQLHAELVTSTEQALAILAAAVARQGDAMLLLNNLRGMQKSFAREAPSALRDRYLDTMCSLVQAVGTPVPPDHH